MSFVRVGVVGAGLIGGSVARRLALLGVDVVVIDPDPATRAQASAAGLVVAEVAPADRDLIVLATPLDVLSSVLSDVATAAPDGVVIDLGSVKESPGRAALAAGLGERYVGVHPMAGTEHTGFEHSSADLLVGASWAVTHGAADTRVIAGVVAWVAEVFESTVVVLDPVVHDRSVARVSHAPHAVAHALLGVAAASQDAAVGSWLAAGSFRDGTRVAGRNAERTANMLGENAAALGPVLDEVIAELSGLRADLGDADALRARLARVVEAAGTVRCPEADFEPCPSLVDALEASRGAGAALVVRFRDGSFETASAGPPATASTEEPR